MTRTQCKHEGCLNSRYSSLGFCNKHYMQFRKYGKTINNTRMDFNECVYVRNHVELIITNKQGEEVCRAKLDIEDLSKAKAIGRWSKNDKEGYIVNRKHGKTTFLHRLVMNATDEDYVDHKKIGIVYRADNRKKNLRICTSQQNSYNRSKQKNNSSGFKGVNWDKLTNKWRAKINKNGVTKHLGLFNNPRKASEAYKLAAKKLHKEFYYE